MVGGYILFSVTFFSRSHQLPIKQQRYPGGHIWRDDGFLIFPLWYYICTAHLVGPGEGGWLDNELRGYGA